MRDATFWRDRREEFESLPEYADSRPDRLGLFAIAVGNRWEQLQGGDVDGTELALLHGRFKAIAQIAGAAAVDVPTDRGLAAWLDLIRKRLPHYYEPVGLAVLSRVRKDGEIRGFELDPATGEPAVHTATFYKLYRKSGRRVRKTEKYVKARTHEAGRLIRLRQASVALCRLLAAEADVKVQQPTPAGRAQTAPQAPPAGPSRPPGKETVTVKEAAKILSVSTDTIRRQIKSGHIKATRVGTKVIRIPLNEIQRLRANDAHLK